MMAPRILSPQYSHDISVIEHLTDELKRGEIAQAIAREVRQDNTRRVIGVYGWWGAGKSYLVSQTIRQLLDSNMQNEQQVVVCTFSPWRYEMEGDLAPGLIKSLHNVERQFLGRNPALANTAMYKVVAERLLLLLELVLEAGIAMSPHGQAVAPTVKGILRALNGQVFQSGHKPSSAIKRDQDEMDAITSQMQELVDRILDSAQAAHEMEAKKRRKGGGDPHGARSWRLVIFIDDLDRCSPEKMVHLLEWLKVHLLVDRCTYVLALDHVAAARAIVGHYKEYLSDEEDLAYGFRYLEKLVDSEYELELAPHVEFMALRQVYGDTVPFTRLSELARELSGGDFPGINNIDDLARLRSLRIPRTMLKIVYKFRRAMDTVLNDAATALRNQLPAAYPFWLLFLVAMYFRLDPDNLSEFVEGRGRIYHLITHPGSLHPSEWGTGPMREFCQYANQLGASVGVTMQLPSTQALTWLGTIMRENALPLPTEY